MKNFIKSYAYILSFTLFLGLFFESDLVLAKNARQAFDSSIVVLAPTSMTNALHDIAKSFSDQNNISVSTTFEASTELSKLIADGEPANIFITEDSSEMINMQRLGVLNVYSLASIASDSLVVVIPKDNFLKKKLTKYKNTDDKLRYLANNFSLVIPDPETDPAGKFIKQAFDRIGAWDAVNKKMLRATNTRNALYLIANGNNAGIIYNSDAASDENIEILLKIPQNYHSKINYQASIVGALDSEDNNKDSQKFIDFLKQESTKQILAKYGFGKIN